LGIGFFQKDKDTKGDGEHKGSILSKTVDDVALPPCIVALWIVRAVVGAAAFFPAERRVRDETRNRRQTTQAPPIGRIRVNDGRGRLQRSDRFLETGSIAEKTGAPPHQVSDLRSSQGLGARG
jgi:hypothetical protein